MLEELSPRNRSAISFLVVAIFAIFLSGIFLGIVYFGVSTFQTSLEGVTCELPGTTYGDCQTWFGDTIYKLLNLKPIIIVFSYLFIFSLVIGLVLMGYKNGENPVMIGVIFILTSMFTYFGIEISNVYRGMLTNEYFYSIMTPFTIYNKIMLNFPWFIAFVGLASLVLSIVNYQRARVNTSASDLDY
ncbi:hypothetical protein [Lutibacter sp.]|uniref:hypothetical protein n=1 Tax=Lutibacter sp. TaxID=1925666 RepID=UPI00349FD9AB